MANPTEANKNELAGRTLWDWNGETMEFAERAYRTWLRGAETVHTQALDFWNAELQKGLDAMNEIAKCRTAAEAFGVQTRYAQEAVQGFFAESQKVIDQLTTMTQQPWAAATVIADEAHDGTEGNGHAKGRGRRR
jgi:hypothetical protein